MAQRGRRQITLKEETPEQEETPISYLQPEILPVQMMMEILREKGMGATTLDKVDREGIIGLFYKHVSPKYQRELRDNRRGKILKRMRERRERKIDDSSWKKMVVESKGKPSSLLSSSTTKPSVETGGDGGERLKPPPSCIDHKRKTIKLGGTKKTSGTGLDFVIKRRSSEEGNNAVDKNAKKLHTDITNGQEKRKGDSPSDPATKKLKVHQDGKTPDLKTNDAPKKKLNRKPISWP